MPWFAAHAILYARFKEGPQSSFPVWEHVYLIEAVSSDEARNAAADRARYDEGDSGGTFAWNSRPAEWVFVGVRKIVEVAHQSTEPKFVSGDEVTFSEFALPTLSAVRELADGQEVELRHVE